MKKTKKDKDELFQNLGFYIGNCLNLTPKETFHLCNSTAMILDIRMEYLSAYKWFNVKNYLALPFGDLQSKIASIPNEIPVIIADATGTKSKEAVLILQENGYNNIANMAGGFMEWERDGLPVNENIKERLSGSCMCQLKRRKT